MHAVAHCAGILEGRPWTEDRAWHERFHRVMDINVRLPLTLTGAPTVFDPTRVVDGIELSDDPILRYRAGAYSESVSRRMKPTS